MMIYVDNHKKNCLKKAFTFTRNFMSYKALSVNSIFQYTSPLRLAFLY